MIRIQRPEMPEILRRKSAQWTRNLLTANDREQQRRAEKKYQHRQIKEYLVRMFHGKCAYCESKITHIDYGHIEHYRPKAHFPELAFEWTNLFLACGICNGTAHKGDQFPESAAGGPFVNPCEDDPQDHFDFHFDTIAKLASVYGRTSRGEITERILGLNRPELRARRSNFVKKLYVIWHQAQNDPEAEAIFREALEDSAEYAAFVRQLDQQLRNRNPQQRVV